MGSGEQHQEQSVEKGVEENAMERQRGKIMGTGCDGEKKSCEHNLLFS